MIHKPWLTRIVLYSFVFLFTGIAVNAQQDSAVNLPNFLFKGFTKSVIKLKSGQVNSATLNYNIIDQEMDFSAGMTLWYYPTTKCLVHLC